MNLLLTGATGFVGRNILIEALTKGAYEKIYVPVRSRKKFEIQLAGEGYGTMPPALEVFEGDSGNWNLPEGARRAEHVIHGAGVIFATTWDEYQVTNVGGTRSLMRALEKPERVVVLSSVSTAGPCDPSSQTREEGGVDRPLTWYGKSKLQMEEVLKTEFGHLPYLCLRPPMIFGPRDHATLPLFKMIRRPLHFKPSFVNKQYNVLAVQDLVSAIFTALDKPGPLPENPHRYYYVTNPALVTDRDILKTAAKVVGAWGLILPVPQAVLKVASRLVSSIPTWRTTIPSLSVDRAREIWPRYWLFSSRKFSADFNWTAKVDFETAVRSTYDWYVKFGQVRRVNKRVRQVEAVVSQTATH